MEKHGARGEVKGGVALLRAFGAELSKVRSYPPLVVTLIAIVAFSIASSAYLTYMAGARPDEAAGLVPSSAYQLALPLEQTGIALVGALVLHMDEESSMVTSLLAVPNRGRLLVAKALTSIVLSTGTALLSVGAAYISRTITLALASDGAMGAGELVRLDALMFWWVMLSLLVTCLSVLVRRAMPVLVTSLAMMLMLSSVLRNITPVAAWLPDQLALCLYQLPLPTGGVSRVAALGGLGAWIVAFVLGAWLSLARWAPRNTM